MRRGLILVALLASAATSRAFCQTPRALLPIEFEHSAEFRWLQKPVSSSRVLDEMKDPSAWRFSGTGKISFPTEPRRALRVDMQLFVDTPAPTRNGLSSVNLQRAFPGEDWRAYNRISLWVRPDY